MEKFITITSHVVSLPLDNVDTDQIIPARYLRVTDKLGLGEGLFADWRYHPDGETNPEFMLNRQESKGASILLAGSNFGCGSSREHAPWALLGWGFRAVIATSFADIFRNNALKNGLLPVEIEAVTHDELLRRLEADPIMKVSIDLPSQTLEVAYGYHVFFPIDAFSKRCLLEGTDQLGYLMSFAEEIEAYESSHG